MELRYRNLSLRVGALVSPGPGRVRLDLIAGDAGSAAEIEMSPDDAEELAADLARCAKIARSGPREGSSEGA